MSKTGFLFLLSLMFILNQSCKKSVASNTGTSVNFPEGGLTNFNVASINFSSDTTVVYFEVELYPAAIKENATITAAVDDAQRLAYNTSSTSLTYAALPDSCYSFGTPAIQIVAGNLTALFSITFYKSRFDLTQSVMLPISIIDADGLAVTDTMKTYYFHLNGNFLTSNLYNDIGTKTEYSGSSNLDSIEGIITCPATKYFNATGLNSVSINYADLGSSGWQYLVTVDPATDSVTVQPNNIIILQTGGASDNTFGVDYKSYDAAANKFHFITHYINDADKLRIVDETFTKQ